jgi:hypothetical protein
MNEDSKLRLEADRKILKTLWLETMLFGWLIDIPNFLSFIRFYVLHTHVYQEVLSGHKFSGLYLEGLIRISAGKPNALRFFVVSRRPQGQQLKMGYIPST